MVFGIVLVAISLHTARWFVTEQHSYPDTYYYLALSYDLAGQPEDEARLNAATFICQAIAPSVDETECVSGWLTVPERYYDIFASRIGYPAVSAPFVAMFGRRGLTFGAALLGAIWGAIFVAAIRLSGGSWRTSLLGVVIVFVLPSGGWATTNSAEGAIYLGITAFLLGSLLVMRGTTTYGLGLLAAATAWLGLTKASSAVSVGMAVLAVGLVVALVSKESEIRHRALVLAGASAIAGVVLLLGLKLLGLPGLNEALQDMYTGHFESPDVANPVGRLVSDLPMFVRVTAGRLIKDSPLSVVAFVTSLAAIFGMARRASTHALSTMLLWAAVGLSWVPLVVVHPVTSEFPRFMAVAWLTVAAGFAAAISCALGVRVRDE